MGKMHADEAEIDEQLVLRLVAGQFPQWAGGRGRALSMALIQLPYYRETTPGIAANAQHVIDEVLADFASAA